MLPPFWPGRCTIICHAPAAELKLEAFLISTGIVALAAQYQVMLPVVVGTTLGMMIANVPAVILGDRIAQGLPVRLVHGIAATVFALLGAATLLGAGERLGF